METVPSDVSAHRNRLISTAISFAGRLRQRALYSIRNRHHAAG
jgi:hypothetical protein